MTVSTNLIGGISVNVIGCRCCGDDHYGLHMNPMVGADHVLQGSCPTTGKHILARFEVL
jgi:hypothetical protein